MGEGTNRVATELREDQFGSPIVLSDLAALAGKLRASYLEAAPWPHIVVDGLMDPATVAAAESQELQRALEFKLQKSPRIVKAETNDVTGSAATAILDALLTPQFVSFLEELTGIADLIPDPSHTRAGLHVSPPGAFQAIHRDFRRHPDTGLYHRINVLVFLNSDWDPGYGGELELWTKDISECQQRILPTAGKMVIFETTATSYHGLPDPVCCPPGRARLSLASYYYTKVAGPNDKRDFSIIPPRRPQDPLYIDIRRFKDIIFTISGAARDVLKRFSPKS